MKFRYISLCLILILCCYCSTEATLAASTSTSTTFPAQLAATQSTATEQAELLQIGACDRLLARENQQLASYCQCKELVSYLASSSHSDLEKEKGMGNANQISQLSCHPKSLAHFKRDLTSVISSASIVFQIDYLSISTNLTLDSENENENDQLSLEDERRDSSASKGQQTNTSRSPSLSSRLKRLPIDHISIQFTQSNINLANHPNATLKAAQTIQEQMIDFVRLINETHLQFLSIFLEDKSTPTSHTLLSYPSRTGSSSTSSSMDDVEGEIKLSKLLAKLPSLSRLELSLGKAHSLLLEPDQFKQQTKLKWLNLASNKQLRFPLQDNNVSLSTYRNNKATISPFSASYSLEYLNLESCNLKRFPLFFLLSIPFKGSASSTSYYGLPNLTSLNLASNKLTSFEQDLFSPTSSSDLVTATCYASTATSNIPNSNSNKHDKHLRVFLLPALTQLDLSHNKLSDMTFKVGQYLLCTMPNLNQLYLQHNKIIHLNLNSLLFHPFAPPYHSLNQQLNTTSSISTFQSQSKINHQLSKLEYVDLSYNNLFSITAIQVVAVQPINSKLIPVSNQVRIKSINLSHNNLKLPLTPINPLLLNTVVFEDSFNFKCLTSYAQHSNPIKSNYTKIDTSITQTRPECPSLQYLDASFILHDSKLHSSLCDFLSPKSVHPSLTEMGDLLNEVILANNRLAILSEEYFSSSQCKDIQVLRLASNEIATIKRDALSALVNLEQLDLSNNLLVHLKDEWIFEKNTHLRVLNLANNRIELLAGDLFSTLVQLEELFLKNNQLSHISTKLFSYNKQLHTLDLSRNKLTHLSNSLFSNLKQLRLLNLHQNQLKQFTIQLFNPTITDDDMTTPYTYSATNSSPKSNDLLINNKQQQQQLFNSSSSLKPLRVNYTKLSHHNSKNQKSGKKRDNRQVSGGTNLLILSFNHIDLFQFKKCNSSEDFYQNVQLLLLNDNKITELESNTFTCFHSIQRLDLHANQITSISELTFSNMSQLEYIDLSENLISSIPLGIFSSLSSLRHVDLGRNRLVEFRFIDTFEPSTMTKASSSSLLLVDGKNDDSHLEFISLSENPSLKLEIPDFYFFISNSTTLKQIHLSGIKQISIDDAWYNKWNGSQHPLTSDSPLYLEILNLSSIQYIDSQLYTSLCNPLTSIEKLDLSFIGTFNIDAEAESLKQLIQSKLYSTELLELNLAGNHQTYEQVNILLTIKSRNQTADRSELTLVDLSSNRIQNWPFVQESARKLHKLRSLDLSKNRMRYLIDGSERGNSYEFGQLEMLNLSSNALLGLIEYPTQRIKSLSTLMPRVKYLDVSHNRLTWIPLQFFDNLDQLSLLKLDHNQLDALVPLFANHQRLLSDLSFNHKLGMSTMRLDLHHSQEQTHDFTSLPIKSLNFDDLIVFENHLNDHLQCYSINEYIERDSMEKEEIDKRKFIDDADFRNLGLNSESGSESSNDFENRDVEENCQDFYELLDTIRVDYNPSILDLDSLEDIQLNRLIHFRQRYSSLTRLPIPDKDKQISQRIAILDLSFNKVQDLPVSKDKSFCSDYNELLTLDLSHNELIEFSLKIMSSCRKLRYLDVSYNKISLLSSNTNKELKFDNNCTIMILKLNNNMLTSLQDNTDLLSLHSLQFIDLRNNPLRTSSLISIQRRPLLLRILTDSNSFNEDVSLTSSIHMKPRLSITSDSLLVSWPNDSETKTTHSLIVTQMDSNNNYVTTKQYRPSQVQETTFDSFQLIKLCTLRDEILTQVCVTEIQQHQHDKKAEDSRCFYLKRPLHIPSCVTDLQQELYNSNNYNWRKEQQFSHSNTTNIDNELPNTNRSKSLNRTAEDFEATKMRESEVADPVLSFIYLLKNTWIRLKDLNINEYLMRISNIKSDSVLIMLDGTYPIHTLTVVKLAIVVGSICIVVLLIIIFAMTSICSRRGEKFQQNRKRSHFSPGTGSESTNNILLADSNSSMTLKSSDSRSEQQASFTTTNCSSSLMSNSKLTGSSLSSSVSNKKNTVIERRLSQGEQQQLLDSNHLLPVNQQICSTPSSSLAPSSVETGETLQAVDSIQSNQNSQVIEQTNTASSVDQYSSRNQVMNHSNYSACQQYKQPVATVMRMVKSSSTGFEGSSNGTTSRNASAHTYGTVNSRLSNYSTLKLKIRAMHEQQQQQHRNNHQSVHQQPPNVQLPPSYTTNDFTNYHTQQQSASTYLPSHGAETYAMYYTPQPVSSNLDVEQHQQQEVDPTTLSLISINTALSNSNYNSSVSQQVSPDSAATFSTSHGEYEAQSIAGKLSTSQQQRANLCQYHHRILIRDPLSSVGKASDVITTSTANVILEQEDEEQYQNNNNELLLMSNLPEPPLSRAIEALENPAQYMFSSSAFEVDRKSGQSDYYIDKFT